MPKIFLGKKHVSQSIKQLGWDFENSPILVMKTEDYNSMWKKSFPNAAQPNPTDCDYTIVDGSHRWYCLWEQDLYDGDKQQGIPCNILHCKGT
jgi:hypothetical protein